MLIAKDTPLGTLIEVLRARFGLDYGGQRLDVLLGSLAEVDPDPQQAARALLSADRPRFAEFVGRTTNTETYFFRHTDHFDALKEHLGRTFASAPPAAFRAWCAGCSSGEEPVSVSAVLDEARAACPARPDVSVLATDINPAALAKAEHARYTEWSFRGVPPEVRERFFVREEGAYRPRPALRQHISFRKHNLLDGAPEPVPFDLVICRNVLIYFDAARFEQAINLLALAVAPGGLLVLGPVESAAAKLPDFDVLHPRGCVLYRKRSAFNVAAVPPSWLLSAPLPIPQPRLSAPGVPAFWPTPPPWPQRPPPPPELPPAPAPVGRAAGEVPALIARARALADQGRLAEAEAMGALIRATHGDSPELHILFALVSLERGEREDAVRELEAAVGAAPDLAMAHYLLGSVLEGPGGSALAEAAYRRALGALEGAPPDRPVAGAGGLTVAELVATIAGALAMPQERRR